MDIDETELNQKLTRAGRKPEEVKKSLRESISVDLIAGRPTDLLWLCEYTNLSPGDCQKIYRLIYDQIDEGTLGGKKKELLGVSVDSLDRVVLDGSEQIKSLSRGYRLVVDPTYTFRWIKVSDTHLGSKHDNIEGLNQMFDRAVAIGAKAVLHSGDLVDGAFAHRDMYLFLHDGCQTFDGQYERVVKHWPKRDDIKTYFIAGNHDHFFQTPVGVDICHHISLAREDMVYLKSESIAEVFGHGNYDSQQIEEVLQSKKLGSGRVGAVRIGPYHLPSSQRNTLVMLLHPGDGSAQTLSYKPQKIIKNLELLLHSFENMQSPFGKRIKPHFLQIGHYHKADITLVRNVYVFQAGTMKLADEFHEVRNLDNMLGYWIVETTSNKEGNVVRLAAKFEKAYVDPKRYTRTVISVG